MACTVQFSYTIGGPSGAKFCQIDATNSPLFCETEFYSDTTSVWGYGQAFYPADGLHGGPPNVSFFSSWRISIPITDVEAGANPSFVLLFGSGPAQATTYTLTTPAALPQSLAVVLNTPLAIVLTASGGGACGSNTFSIVTNPGHGTLSGTAPNVTYTPTTGYTGGDSFTFQVVGCSVTTQAAVTLTVWDGCA